MIFAMHALKAAHPQFAYIFWTLGSLFGLAGYVIAWIALVRTGK